MGMLDTGIASIFSAALSGLYLDGTLSSGTGEPIYNGAEITGYSSPSSVPIKLQVDVATEAMRREDGYAEGDCRIIVLAKDIPAITSDHRITARGSDWLVMSAELDAAASHWVCRARRA